MRLPTHLGIIMDGNGRWATARGQDRSKGHLEGLKATRRVTRAASEAGIRFLSLYAFSTENWKRSSAEVGFLMGLVVRHLEDELDFYRSLGLRVVHSGDRAGLGREVLAALDRIASLTAGHQGMVVNLALNHGGRDEILRALSRWRASGAQGDFGEAELRSHLDLPWLPDLDLVIRSGGDFRTSNFMLWQAAYAEYHFSPRLWPDFGAEDLHAALADYDGRERRFGGVVEKETGLSKPVRRAAKSRRGLSAAILGG
jgi:undecaprenyl diphosphate synthase